MYIIILIIGMNFRMMSSHRHTVINIIYIFEHIIKPTIIQKQIRCVMTRSKNCKEKLGSKFK
jgi:hypothetical protein